MATTSPVAGLKTSLTAFTDSMLPSFCPSLQMRADLWQFDEDDVAEFILRVVGDSDRACITFNFDPFMILRVAEICWIHFLSLTSQCAFRESAPFRDSANDARYFGRL
jgi:hypothetical protein